MLIAFRWTWNVLKQKDNSSTLEDGFKVFTDVDVKPVQCYFYRCVCTREFLRHADWIYCLVEFFELSCICRAPSRINFQPTDKNLSNISQDPINQLKQTSVKHETNNLRISIIIHTLDRHFLAKPGLSYSMVRLRILCSLKQPRGFSSSFSPPKFILSMQKTHTHTHTGRCCTGTKN